MIVIFEIVNVKDGEGLLVLHPILIYIKNDVLF